MKKISLLITGLLFVGNAFAAPAPVSNVRATRSAPAATTAAAPTTAVRSARSAAPAVASRSGTTVAPQNAPVVAARAATKQNVIQMGTGVAAATANTAVDAVCREKYEGCMDSFCMLDNENGGRCLCSDRKAELDTALTEIERLNAQANEMNLVGVERISLGTGDKADYVLGTAAATEQGIVGAANSAARTPIRNRLELDDLFGDALVFDDGIFAEENADPLKDKTGDALQAAARDLCVAQIPECSKDIRMLQLMYSQQVQSNCAAYGNDLKRRRDTAAQNLATAQANMRAAALTAYENANKYDLGQCAVQMRICMQDAQRGNCSADWTGCVGIAAAENAATGLSSRTRAREYEIKGSATTIKIASSTYDSITSKRPLCESVTNSCVNAVSKDKDAVWNTFLREIAPALKSAELVAESNRRTNCIGNISECFRKGCMDTLDPKDPDGSFDMCITRPEAMLNICKVQLNECGISTASAAEAQKNMIWDFITQRLAAMRTNTCFAQVKECITSDDRCGKDYANCIGLDTDSIIKMCPYDTLTGCQQVYAGRDIRGVAVYDEISTMIDGIFMGIQNNALVQCQKAADEAMIKVCGSTEDCNGLAVDDGIGSRSLEYKICGYTSSGDSLDINYTGCKTSIAQITDDELRTNTPLTGVLDGVIFWESVDFNAEDEELTNVSDYARRSETTLNSAERSRVESELAQLQRSIKTAINVIESDPIVQYCMNGREVQGMNGRTFGRAGADARGRFPDLTRKIRMTIASYALKAAKDNYNAKYDELIAKMLEDQVAIGKRISDMQDEANLNVFRALALKSCKALAFGTSLPVSPKPPRNVLGKMIGVFMMVGGAVTAPFTGGASLVMTAMTAMTAVGITALAGGDNNANSMPASVPSASELTASQTTNEWNYKQVVTTIFNWETLKCTRTIRTRQCDKTKSPLFNDKWCKKWGEEKTSEKVFQF